MLKNTVERTEETIRELKDGTREITQYGQKRGKICGVLEGKECESEEECKETMAENSSNLAINVSLHIKKN